MPKNKNFKKRAGDKTQDITALPLPRLKNDDDNESVTDKWSTQSVFSNDSSWPGSATELAASVEDDTEEVTEQENFEDCFSQFLDGLSQKSVKARLVALQGIQIALQKKYVAEYITNRKETATDSVLRCLRKGKGDEQAMAAECLSLLAVQLGSEAQFMFSLAQPVLTSILKDNATNFKTRGACATTLATCCLLCCEDLEIIKLVSQTLEDIFALGYGKGENSPTVLPELSWLIAQALSAWCLLLTVAPQYEVQTHIKNHLGPLQDLLKNSDVDLRMTAGEAIALLYELAREFDEDFEHEGEATLFEMLKQLATDSVKHRAKKDRRQQRSCFRDVQGYVVERENPSETVKLGKENLLELNTWTQKRQYNTLCQVLMTGMLVHMKVNPILRDIFDLGAPGLDDYSHIKSLSKAQRTFINAASFKARTKARAKHRDKRAVTVSSF